MAMVLPLALGAAALLFLMRGKSSTPGGVSSEAATRVPVVMADDMTVAPALTAAWHPTNDQNKLFGPVRPVYYSLNGYFLFPNPSSPHYDKYRPDWMVDVKAT